VPSGSTSPIPTSSRMTAGSSFGSVQEYT
jgi:hypothetical protein